MKTVSFFILIVLGLKVNSQEIYRNKETGAEVIFLGNYRDEECLRVLDSGNIYFIEKDKLEQINELNPKEFLQLLSKNKLRFRFEGSEPFWSLDIQNNSFIFYDNQEIKFSVEFFFDNQSGFNLMFQSSNKKVFGLIKRVDTKFDKTQACNLSITEYYNVFELYITINGKVYKGCGYIDII